MLLGLSKIIDCPGASVPFATSDNMIAYTLENHAVDIPDRMYLLDIADAEYEKLTQTQKQILCCIYTRNCNGYVREKYLRKLLDMPMEQWVIPFIVKLCDEYVIEILEIIYDKLKEREGLKRTSAPWKRTKAQGSAPLPL